MTQQKLKDKLREFHLFTQAVGVRFDETMLDEWATLISMQCALDGAARLDEKPPRAARFAAPGARSTYRVPLNAGAEHFPY